MTGRVLEDNGILVSRTGDRLWQNLVNSYKRFNSNEIPFAKLQLSLGDYKSLVEANQEGFFIVQLKRNVPFDLHKGISFVGINLVEPLLPGHTAVEAQGEVIFPEAGAKFGLVSDIDDTVIHTHASNPVQTIWNLVSRNAYTRKPFPGTAAFYRGLWQGMSGEDQNPIFYVSTSPWNIYDQLEQFLHLQGFPPRPVFYLRDWGITHTEIIPTEHHEHKKNFIRLILEMYPEIPLILIGDSNLQDPEIYVEITIENPGRILAIYLREVTKKQSRIESIHRLSANLSRHGVPVVLTDTVLTMAEHAANQGWITEGSLESVRHEIEKS